MIYRRRVKKSGYSIRLLSNNLKIEFGKRVLYIPFLGVGKKLHTLRHIHDSRGHETVTHERRRDRETLPRGEFVPYQTYLEHMAIADVLAYSRKVGH